MLKSNCEECYIRKDCEQMYPCEHNNALEEVKWQFSRYKDAWDKLREFVEALQEGFENTFGYSNPQIEEIEGQMNQLEEKLLKW